MQSLRKMRSAISFASPRTPTEGDVFTDMVAECGAATGDQGLREQQMESHRTEGWEAC